MAKYTYKATTKEGEIVSGEMAGNSYDEVYKELNTKGLMPINIDQKIELSLNKTSLKNIASIEIGKMSIQDKVIFSRQLAVMLAAGLSITKAMEILIQQTQNVKTQEKLSEIYKDIQAGEPLSSSFRKQDFIFNELQLSLIEAGEQSGNLVEIIEQIADDMKKSSSLQSKIKGAMIYPIVIFVVMIVVVAVLMIYMIPAVEKMYADFGDKELPAVSQILVNISHALSNPAVIAIILTVIIATIAGFRYFYSTDKGKALVDKFLLVVPIFGDLISKMQIYEMSRLLYLLIKSGIPIIDALKSTSKAMGNYHFRKALENAAVDVSKGVPLAVPLSNSRVIPIIVVRLIATGEQTGKLEGVLAEINSFYGDQVDELTSNLTKLMEPLIMIVAGLLVAFLAVAIYLPIYNLGNIIQ